MRVRELQKYSKIWCYLILEVVDFICGWIPKLRDHLKFGNICLSLLGSSSEIGELRDSCKKLQFAFTNRV